MYSEKLEIVLGQFSVSAVGTTAIVAAVFVICVTIGAIFFARSRGLI